MNYTSRLAYTSSILKTKDLYLGFLVTFALSTLVFYYAFVIAVWQDNPHAVSDLPTHAQVVLDAAGSHHFPAYSLWYRLIYVLSGFSNQYDYVAYISIGVLGFLTAVKYLLSFWILKKNGITNERMSALTSFALIFCMPLLSYYHSRYHVVVGNIVPNQWHNSTLILAMPVYLLLFYYSVKKIKSDEFFAFFLIGCLSFIGTLCKPNYALVFLPVICMTILVITFRSHQYLSAVKKCTLVMLPSLLLLLYQWYFTFAASSVPLHGVKTIIAPFLVWSYYSPHIPLSFLLSIAFPLLVLIFYFKKINFGLTLAWLVFLFALAIFCLLAEYPVFTNGNYGWGVISSSYILFLYSLSCLLSQPNDWKYKIALTVFGMHFLSGCFLLGSFFIQQTPLHL